MDLPWSSFTLASAGGAFALVKFAPAYSLHESYFQTFFVLLVAVSIAAIFYAIILYPYFFSPFRHLPQPSVSRLWVTRSAQLER